MSHPRSIVPALLGLLLASACGPFSPEAQQTNRYLKDLQPLLVENGHLAERVLLLSAKVYNKDGDTDSLAQAWTGDVVPLAEHLHHQAQFVEAIEPSEALVLADPDEWREGRAQATQVKLREEEWFKEVNQILLTTNQQIDPTP